MSATVGLLALLGVVGAAFIVAWVRAERKNRRERHPPAAVSATGQAHRPRSFGLLLSFGAVKWLVVVVVVYTAAAMLNSARRANSPVKGPVQ